MEDEVGAAESTRSTLESVADQPPTASTTAAVASSSTDAQVSVSNCIAVPLSLDFSS